MEYMRVSYAASPELGHPLLVSGACNAGVEVHQTGDIFVENLECQRTFNSAYAIYAAGREEVALRGDNLDLLLRYDYSNLSVRHDLGALKRITQGARGKWKKERDREGREGREKRKIRCTYATRMP